MQNYKTGKLKVEEVPAPLVRPECVLIKTKASFISVGTERTKIETARMSIIEKAICRLDLVKIVVNNIKQEGLIFTIKKALNKLDTPISLGYSCAGEIIDIGEGVTEFKVGERVACVGEIYAAHSEINVVPSRFTVSIPENVDYSEASFVGLGAIALNSVELAQLRKDELVAVIGLGLIGQMVAQILKAIGCKVVGVEIDESKISLAKKLGMDVGVNLVNDDVDAIVNSFSSGVGVDAVFITAASKNNLPIEIAGRISRNKGRVILVGAMPILIPRKDYYEKELFFAISRGFGAGLYYKEDKNRWYAYNYRSVSVKENMQNFISLLAQEKVTVKPLISYRFHITEAKEAYELIRTQKKNCLGVVFQYDEKVLQDKKIVLLERKGVRPVNIGFIGAGSFAQGYILPILKKHKDVRLIGVATATGINTKNVARKFGFEYCTTDYNEILNDERINCVFVMTRHNLHAKLVIEALKKKKHIFVEKPLCLNEAELREIIFVYNRYNTSMFMVGFNRRFSPFVKEVKDFFKHRLGPLMLHYRVNAGSLSPQHWVYDIQEGGGRIIGEVCHFVDLLQYITAAAPEEIFAVSMQPSEKNILDDNISIVIKFKDFSVGTITYNSIGDISYPRERIEIFGENSAVVIDNFKKAVFSRADISHTMHRVSRDMGHKNEIGSFVSGLRDSTALIPFREIVLATVATFKIIESLKSKLPVKIDLEQWLKDS